MLDYDKLSKPYAPDPDEVTIYDEYGGAGRGNRAAVREKIESLDPPRLSKILADRVTGPALKDSIILVVGVRGAGKSFFCLDLAIKTAKEIASRIGGEWRDYFNPDRSVAVISGDEIVSRLQNLQKHQVVLLDDVGADALSARRFMSKENLDLSSILQTCRTERNTLILSSPLRELSDINISRLCTYFIEVTESFHAQGISLVKVFTHRPRFRGGKPLYPFLSWNRGKIIRFISHRPPDDVVAAYNRVRDEQARKVMEKQRAGDDEGESHKENKRKRYWQNLMEQHGKQVKALHEKGVSNYGIQKELGLNQSTVIKLVSLIKQSS